MRRFPQLLTGATAQYPLLKRRRTRTVANVGEDGHTVKYPDPEEARLGWELQFSWLTDEEWKALETLFSECEGSLRSFLFLDPAANLLARTSDLSATVWHKDPLLNLTGDIDDPLGGEQATRLVNTGQIAQGISQMLDAPADFFYCFSVYARSSQPAYLTLKRFGNAGVSASTVAVATEWRRYASSGNLGSQEERMQFGLDIPPGASVYVFGLQVEAQLGASKYKRTLAAGGVYPNARFSEDSLTVVTEGPNQHTVGIGILNGVEA